MYEPVFKLERTGVSIHFYTNHKLYNPVHWHSAVELIYVLTGASVVTISQKTHTVRAGDFVVIDANELHEYRYERNSSIMVIHFSRKSMREFVPGMREYHFHCTLDSLKPEQYKAYKRICQYLMEIPLMHVEKPMGYQLRCHAVAMEIFYDLLHHFTTKKSRFLTERTQNLKRMYDITEYIDQHYSEQLTLDDVASHFFLSNAYFSRLFHKHMGVTFISYLNQVRMSHVYSDIRNTKSGIMELAEKHGFPNYKVFNRLFHATYGCTPREARIVPVNAYTKNQKDDTEL